MNCCSICDKSDDLHCPACDKAFCISCFVDHGKLCYEQSKRTEQGEHCSVCGRYATHAFIVHCSECQIEICRSCLYAHKKTHQTKKCSGCNGDPAGPFVTCPDCQKELCEACMEIHRKTYGHKSREFCADCHRSYDHVLTRWVRCPDCAELICLSCWEHHRWKHTTTTTYRCSGCNRTKEQGPHQEPPFWKCPTCSEYYCDVCTMRHTHIHTRSEEFTRENLNDFLNRMRNNRYTWNYSSFFHETESDAYKQHYQSHRTYTHQQSYTTTSGVSQELVAAFSMLQLSTRATVQEVKNAFRRKAKQGEYKHPDVGGSEAQFKQLNNAYELAMEYAKGNER